MCPTLGMCIVIYVSENINLHIKHADKTHPAQVIWAGNQDTLPHGKIHTWS